MKRSNIFILTILLITLATQSYSAPPPRTPVKGIEVKPKRDFTFKENDPNHSSYEHIMNIHEGGLHNMGFNADFMLVDVFPSELRNLLTRFLRPSEKGSQDTVHNQNPLGTERKSDTFHFSLTNFLTIPKINVKSASRPDGDFVSGTSNAENSIANPLSTYMKRGTNHKTMDDPSMNIEMKEMTKEHSKLKSSNAEAIDNSLKDNQKSSRFHFSSKEFGSKPQRKVELSHGTINSNSDSISGPSKPVQPIPYGEPKISHDSKLNPVSSRQPIMGK